MQDTITAYGVSSMSNKYTLSEFIIAGLELEEEQ